MIPSKETHQLTQWPSIGFIRSELHQLLAVVVASKPIAEAANTRAAGLEDLLDVAALEDDAITRLLISVAINLRVLDDRNGQPMKHLDAEVGRLIKNIPASAEEGEHASVRVVCNKVIHSESVEIERNRLAEHCTYVDPEVTFYGREGHGKKQSRWHLRIDVVNFVHEALLGLAEVELSDYVRRSKKRET